ncbi:hypothetical protein [Candidatus Clostridium stratigraminis]|uniref:SHOCT domain-containing protein n=1 Tax=Candidatus Clostridium stratigraminis TaxID=3381661 RepID=A0ABW8T3R1_9CLOT
MDIGSIFLSLILLFTIIYVAVRLAIIPLLYKPEEDVTNTQESGLVKLRDIGILSNDELEYVIKLYQDRHAHNRKYEQYQKYAKVLSELKEIDYFNDEEYSSRIDKLKRYFNVS